MLQRELQSNEQLRDAGEQARLDFLRQAAQNATNQGRVLRAAFLRSTLTLLSAAVAAVLGSSVWGRRIVQLWPSSVRDFSIASIAFFVWATFARMGWKGQTFGGDTPMEKLDQFLFRLLYWLGTFSGVLAYLLPDGIAVDASAASSQSTAPGMFLLSRLAAVPGRWWSAIGLAFDIAGVIGVAVIPAWAINRGQGAVHFGGVAVEMAGIARRLYRLSWMAIVIGFVLQLIGQFRP